MLAEHHEDNVTRDDHDPRARGLRTPLPDNGVRVAASARAARSRSDAERRYRPRGPGGTLPTRIERTRLTRGIGQELAFALRGARADGHSRAGLKRLRRPAMSPTMELQNSVTN